MKTHYEESQYKTNLMAFLEGLFMVLKMHYFYI